MPTDPLPPPVSPGNTPTPVPVSARRLTPDEAAGFYSKADIAHRFNASRNLLPEAEAQWAEAIPRHVPPGAVRTALDLGCGTGRFTGMLAGLYAGESGTVIGIDPSARMLESARQAVSGPRTHFRDEGRALRSVRSVLRDGGHFCVRTCTVEALDSYVYQRFIPEAKAVDLGRFPTRDALRSAIEQAGFTLSAFETVHQPVARNLPEYLYKVALRAHSDLQAITDEQFAHGFAELEAWAATQCAARAVVEDVDFFTFVAG
jgi:SAM-dependent methyltransferase